MNGNQFDAWCKKVQPEIARALRAHKADIDDDMIAEGDTIPSMQITISTDDQLEHWSMQTGDNSFTGSCYGDPYWGIGTLTRRSNTKQLAYDLLEDLASTIQFT